MKIHPMPMKFNIKLQYNIASELPLAGGLSCRQKKLKRLPHIFAKVLELPFDSNTDVFMEETPDFLKFVVSTDVVGEDANVMALQTVEIYPGICKILILGDQSVGGFDFGESLEEVDRWRFRLPVSTRLDTATASYRDGELVVMVPKGIGNAFDDDEDDAMNVTYSSQ